MVLKRTWYNVCCRAIGVKFMAHKLKEQKNIEKIKLFCSYLKDWKANKNYYINDFLPQLMKSNLAGLEPEAARQLFLEIRKETSVSEWKNLIETIVYIQENSSASSTEISIKNPVNIKIAKEKFLKKLPKLKENYGFEGFVHTTSFDNFISIMQDKTLYCRETLELRHKQFSDIALQAVIEKTSFAVSKFVRFYWRTKTPTNYTNEGIKAQKVLKRNFVAHSAIPVIMVFNPEIFFEGKKVLFTDKNAGTKDFSLSANIENLEFEKIFDDRPKEKISDSEWKKICQARCSEIFYPSEISTKYITKIIFRSECDMERAKYLIGNDERFVVDKNSFCNLWLSIDSYKYEKETCRIHINFHKGDYFKLYGLQLRDYIHIIRKYDNNGNLLEECDCSNAYEKEKDSITIQLGNNVPLKIIGYYIDGHECIRVKIDD